MEHTVKIIAYIQQYLLIVNFVKKYTLGRTDVILIDYNGSKLIS